MNLVAEVGPQKKIAVPSREIDGTVKVDYAASGRTQKVSSKKARYDKASKEKTAKYEVGEAPDCEDKEPVTERNRMESVKDSGGIEFIR